MVDYVKDFLLKKEDPYAKSVDAYINNPSMSSPIYMAQPEQPKVDLSNAVNSAMRNWGAAMDVRNRLNTAEGARQEPQEVGEVETLDVNSLKPRQAPQEVNLKQAEQELQEAQELDKQSGSEGYEAKEDGVFNRIKNWGSSVSDYLFGKGVDPNSDEGREAEMLQELAAEEKQRLLDKYGVLGYYGGGALGSLLGKQGLQDWNDFKKDFEERGIGAVTQRANSLMEDMARSPFSKFVDPTTLLGGRRTMVNDIDSYFNQQGLPALRNELLAQDIARLKTPIGQAEEWAKKTPEQQAAMATYPGLQKAAGYTGVGAKTPLQNAKRQIVSLINEGWDPEDAYDKVANDTGYTREELMYDSPARQTQLKNVADFGRQKVLENVQSGLSVPEAVAKYREDYGDYETPSDILLNSRTSGTYAPNNKAEKLSYEEEKKAQDLDLADFSDLKKEVNKNADGAAMNAQYGRSLNGLLDEAAANGIHVTGGGDLGKALRRFGSNYGLVDPTTKQLVSGAAVLSEAVFGNQIANIIANQNRGNITERERDLFARQAINLGASEEETRLRLDLYVLYNELAINRARKLESLSNLRPLEQYRQFKAWQNEQYDKTASLVKAVVDSHLGAGFFDKREREYNGGI